MTFTNKFNILHNILSFKFTAIGLFSTQQSYLKNIQILFKPYTVNPVKSLYNKNPSCTLHSLLLELHNNTLCRKCFLLQERGRHNRYAIKHRIINSTLHIHTYPHKIVKNLITKWDVAITFSYFLMYSVANYFLVYIS